MKNLDRAAPMRGLVLARERRSFHALGKYGKCALAVSLVLGGTAAYAQQEVLE
jgi:hypothetical protein